MVGAGFNEIVAPDVIRPFGAQPDAASVVEPQSSARLLLSGNFESFATPDTLHSILACTPARLLPQRRDPPVAVAAVLAGQADDRLPQPVFVVALGGLIALGSPRLMDQAARSPFTPSFFPSVLNGDAAPLGT